MQKSLSSLGALLSTVAALGCGSTIVPHIRTAPEITGVGEKILHKVLSQLRAEKPGMQSDGRDIQCTDTTDGDFHLLYSGDYQSIDAILEDIAMNKCFDFIRYKGCHPEFSFTVGMYPGSSDPSQDSEMGYKGCQSDDGIKCGRTAAAWCSSPPIRVAAECQVVLGKYADEEGDERTVLCIDIDKSK